MEVVERSERQEGAQLSHLITGDSGVPGDGKSYPNLWSLKEFYMPTPDRPVHTNPHTDTHMHGGNKYFPYQSAPSLIPQVGSLQRGGAKCSVFQGKGGCWGKERSDSVSICWLEIHLGVLPRRELREISCFSIAPAYPFTDGGQF